MRHDHQARAARSIEIQHEAEHGLRGLLMPALGMLLYIAFGWWVWGVALAFSLLGLWGFKRLAREEALLNA